MSDNPNLQSAMTDAVQFVQETWQQTVMGLITVPGARAIGGNIGLRKTYADSIVSDPLIKRGGGMAQSVVATDKIAKQLEHGSGSWDMKPGLLKGPMARLSKKGIRYNIIPFRHGAKGNANSNFPTMPKDIYQQARALKASVKAANGMKWGGKLTGTETAHPAGQNKTSGYQHKSGRYEGMVKVQKDYAKATQSKYMTFRIVSDKSPAGSWIHPGYKAHHIAASVSEFCRPGVEAMIREAATADLMATVKFEMELL